MVAGRENSRGGRSEGFETDAATDVHGVGPRGEEMYCRLGFRFLGTGAVVFMARLALLPGPSEMPFDIG